MDIEREKNTPVAPITPVCNILHSIVSIFDVFVITQQFFISITSYTQVVHTRYFQGSHLPIQRSFALPSV